MRRSHAIWLGLGLVLVLTACGGAPAAPDAPAAFCTDDAPRAPTFANMQLLFTGCTSCHAASVPLDLVPDTSYAALVGRAAPSYVDPPVNESCGGVLVTPGNPATSYLFAKVSQPVPCAGSRMPLDEFGESKPLPACSQKLIHDWIASGAPAE